MKKLAIMAVALMVGTSLAFAASLAIPWYVDNGATFNGIPGAVNGVTGIVTIKSNRTDVLDCAVSYYNAEGFLLEMILPISPG